MSSAYIEPTSKNLPLLPLHLLRALGISIVSDWKFWKSIKHLTKRRQLLLALVQDEWTWNSVASSQTTNQGNGLDNHTLIDQRTLH